MFVGSSFRIPAHSDEVVRTSVAPLKVKGQRSEEVEKIT
jgi:hypothetical protein